MMIFKRLCVLLKKAFTKNNRNVGDCNCNAIHTMYDYVIWWNTYQNIWYAIHRNCTTYFFAGGPARDCLVANKDYFQADNIADLTALIMKQNETK